MTLAEQSRFQTLICDHYQSHSRSMPWRDNVDPYRVLVSELMLQQTGVSRVEPKFRAFVNTFEDFESLAAAPLAHVLRAWSGLGYNRRAKFLWLTAQAVVNEYNGQLPHDHDTLITLPGVGSNTAGAILAYAFNQPVIFIETNIRTVYLHYFFADHEMTVTDTELRRYIQATLDTSAPRHWYWALMDYGSYLKKTNKGHVGKSHHYKKQSPLKGTMREMRGHILKVLTRSALNESLLAAQVDADHRFKPALMALKAESMIEKVRSVWRLTGSNESS